MSLLLSLGALHYARCSAEADEDIDLCLGARRRYISWFHFYCTLYPTHILHLLCGLFRIWGCRSDPQQRSTQQAHSALNEYCSHES